MTYLRSLRGAGEVIHSWSLANSSHLGEIEASKTAAKSPSCSSFDVVLSLELELEQYIFDCTEVLGRIDERRVDKQSSANCCP